MTKPATRKSPLRNKGNLPETKPEFSITKTDAGFDFVFKTQRQTILIPMSNQSAFELGCFLKSQSQAASPDKLLTVPIPLNIEK